MNTSQITVPEPLRQNARTAQRRPAADYEILERQGSALRRALERTWGHQMGRALWPYWVAEALESGAGRAFIPREEVQKLARAAATPSLQSGAAGPLVPEERRALEETLLAVERLCGK